MWVEAVREDYWRRKDQIAASSARGQGTKAAGDAEAEAALKATALERIQNLQTQAGDMVSMWQQAGTAVQDAARELSNLGSEKDNVAEIAARAAVARREFDGIPGPIKATIVGLGMVNDEMRRLTATRDNLRSLFGDMFREGLRNGSDLTSLRASAAFFEKRLDYANRMKALFDRGQGAAKRSIDFTEGQRSAWAVRQKQLQAEAKALNKKGAVVPGTSGAIAPGGPSYDYRPRFPGVGGPTTPRAGARSKMHLAGRLMGPGGAQFSRAAAVPSGTPKRNAQGLYELPGGGAVSTLEQYYALTGARPSGPPQLTPFDVSKLPRISGKPSASTPKPARGYTPPKAPQYDGKLLPFDLPKGWGGEISQYGAMPGESRTWRLRVQEMLADTKAVEKAAKDAKMTVNEYTAMWRYNANDSDYKTSLAAVIDAARNGIRDMERQIRLMGRDNNPIAILLDEFEHGADRLLPGHLQEAKLKSALDLYLKQIDQSMKEARRDFRQGMDGRNAVRPLLESDSFTRAGYDRASFAENKRREIWGSEQITQMYEEADALRKQGKELEANTILKKANAIASEQLSMAIIESNAKSAQSTLEWFAEERRAHRSRMAMLQYERDLLRKGVNPGAARMAAEREQARRDTAERLEESTMTPGVLGKGAGRFSGKSNLEQFAAGMLSPGMAQAKAGQAAENMGAEQAAGGVNNRLAGINTQRALDRLEGRYLGAQRTTTLQYAADNPELEVQLRLLEKRNQLQAADLQKQNPAERLGGKEIDRQVKAYEQIVRSEMELRRIQDSRQNAVAAIESTLEAQKQGEMMLAQTARERLAIEWKYVDALRARRGIETSPEEKQERDRQAALADSSDRISRIQSEAQTIQGILSNAIETGFHDPINAVPNLFRDVVSAMQREISSNIATSITNKWFQHLLPNGKDAIAQTEAGLATTAGIFKRKGILTPEGNTTDGTYTGPLPMAPPNIFEQLKGAGFGGGFMGQMVPLAPAARMPVPAGAGAAANGGGMSATTVVIQASNVGVKATGTTQFQGNLTVKQGANNQPNGMPMSGPSVSQILTDVFGGGRSGGGGASGSW